MTQVPMDWHVKDKAADFSAKCYNYIIHTLENGLRHVCVVPVLWCKEGFSDERGDKRPDPEAEV